MVPHQIGIRITSAFLVSVKFIFSEKATKIEKIFTVDLIVTTYCHIDGKDFLNFCGLLRKHELYNIIFAYFIDLI